MKILYFSLVVLFTTFNCISAQNIPGVPNGSVGKDSRDDYDNGIRIRSIELERIKRESNRSEIAAKAAENRKINYSQIKKDFELVQELQNEIVKTYVTGKQINYGRISELASRLNNCAGRLDKNLSLSDENTKQKPTNDQAPEAVSDLIVVLDGFIGKFVTSPVFKNLNVIESNDAEKAEFELRNIIRLSEVLAREAEKQK